MQIEGTKAYRVVRVGEGSGRVRVKDDPCGLAPISVSEAEIKPSPLPGIKEG